MLNNHSIASKTSEEPSKSIITDLPLYGFYLLSQTKGEEPYTISLDYTGEEMPTEKEINTYLMDYVRGYALSRWFERATLLLNVPSSISAIENDDWAGEKVIRARGGECRIAFIDDANEFLSISEKTRGVDLLNVYVGGLDINGLFLPYLNHSLYMLTTEKGQAAKNKGKQDFTAQDFSNIEKKLAESPMVFATSSCGIRGVKISVSGTKGTISNKIMERVRETLYGRSQKQKKMLKTGGTKGVQGAATNRVEFILGL